MFTVCSLMIETLGEAKAHGWRITARCAWGKRDGMKTRRECLYRYKFDLETFDLDARRGLPDIAAHGAAEVPKVRYQILGRCGHDEVSFDRVKQSRRAAELVARDPEGPRRRIVADGSG